MSKITLITTNKFGKKEKEIQIDMSNSALAFISKGNFIEVEGIEYFIVAVKTTVEDGRITNIRAKLILDGTTF